MFGREENQNVYVFIDSQNLMQSVREQGWKLDHKKFVNYLKENYKAKKIYYFVGFMKENKYLYDMLQSAGYTLMYKPAIKTPEGTIKANVDTDLVLQAMIDINNYDKAIILSGDGDFANLIKYLNQQNKLEKVIVPNSTKYSGLLNEASGGRIGFMDLIKNEVGIKSPSSGGCLGFFRKIFG